LHAAKHLFRFRLFKNPGRGDRSGAKTVSFHMRNSVHIQHEAVFLVDPSTMNLRPITLVPDLDDSVGRPSRVI